MSFIASPESTGRNLEPAANLMYPMLLDDGRLLVPRRAESDDGQTVGDCWVEVRPDDADYAEWLEAIERLDALKEMR